MLGKLSTLREEREEGFTLIELLVVVLIIGILTAIAIPAFLNQRRSAVDASVQSDIRNAATQIETWTIKQGAKEVPLPSDPAGTSLAEIRVSDGTELEVLGTSFQYQLIGKNAGGDVASSDWGFVWESDHGGFVTVDGMNYESAFIIKG